MRKSSKLSTRGKPEKGETNEKSENQSQEIILQNRLFFVGKYTENLHHLEMKFCKNNHFDAKYKIYDDNIHPNVLRHHIDEYDYDVMTIFGNVKPTMLLKKLISESKIILFTFDYSQANTLFFLIEGWGKIIDKKDLKNPNQKRYLVGLGEPKKGFDRIHEAEELFNCKIISVEEALKVLKPESKNEGENRQEGKSDNKNSHESVDVNDNEVNAADKGKNYKKRNENWKGKDTKNDDDKKETQNLGRRNANDKKDIEKNKEGKCNDKVDLKDKDNEEEENDENEKDKEGDDDDSEYENDEEEEADYENEEVTSMTDRQYVNYRLFKKSKIAHIIESPKAKGDVFIQSFVCFDSVQYKITRIDDRAFADSKIESLSFAEHSRVKSIGNFAFENSPLSTISIPKSLKKIDDHCLCGASNLVEIEVNEENSNFSVKDGFVYYNESVEDKNKTVRQNRQFIFALKDFKSKTKYGLVEFKKSESTLIQNANDPPVGPFFFGSFYKCQNICHLTVVSHSKINIGKFAFNHSKNLQTVEFVGTEMNIATQCFNECSSLSSVSFVKLDKATFGGAAFNGCSSLKELDISAESELHFQKECFVGVPNLQSFTVSSKDIHIGERCFSSCKLLSSISLKKADSISIGRFAFHECESLKIFEVSAPTMLHFGIECFRGAPKIKSVTASSSTIVVDDKCFMFCKSLSSISLTNARTVKIGLNSFSECALTEFKVRVTSGFEFGNYCFSRAVNLQSVEINGAASLVVNEGSFENCLALASVSFPDAFKVTFGKSSFTGCCMLKNISIPHAKSVCFDKSCFKVTKSLFSIDLSCSEVTVNGDCFDDHFSFSDTSMAKIKEMRTLALRLIVHKNTSALSVFAQCSSLESMAIEVSDTALQLILERDSFTGFSKLRSLRVVCGSLIIGASCFMSMQSLHEVEINCEELSLEQACFQKCRNLSKFWLINAAYVRIGPYAFNGCTMLDNLNIQPSEKVGLSSYFTRLRYIGTKEETCLVRDKRLNKYVLRAKSLNKEIRSREDANSFFKKMVTFSGLQSPSLLKQLGFGFKSFDNRPHPTILSKYIPKCSLEESFNKFYLDGTKKCIILIGVAVGMEYLHAKGIAHGNLAPPNVLLDDNLYPHISDFDIQSGKLTRYSAPELFQKSPCSLESDVYSFSILAYELITAKRFCNNMKLNEVVDRVVARNERPNLSLIQDGSIASLLARCWSPVPSGRPRFAEILAELLNIGFIRALKASESDVSHYIEMFGSLMIDQIEKSAPKQPEEAPQPESPEPAAGGVRPAITKRGRSMPKSPPINGKDSSPYDPQKEQIIIMRYLRTKLFDKENKVNRYEIRNRRELQGSAGDIATKILSTTNAKIIYYSVKYNPISVEYYKKDTPIAQLPSYFNIQYRPDKDTEYRICVLCCQSDMVENTDFGANTHSIVIKFNPQSKFTAFKKAIMDYLVIDKSLKIAKPSLSVFKNNKFTQIGEANDITNREDPVFVSWNEQDFLKICEHISNHMTNQTKI